MKSIALVADGESNNFPFIQTGAVFTEQRRTPRRQLQNAVKVAFYNNGKLYCGYMTELSAGGARLLLPVEVPDNIPDLSRGRKMECYLLNRYANSKCRGTIQWIMYDGSLLQWGISFIELASEKDDPLRTIIGTILG